MIGDDGGRAGKARSTPVPGEVMRSLSSLPVVSASAPAPLGLRERLQLPDYTAEGELNHAAGAGRLRCVACAHRCVIADGMSGSCGVRFNHGGTLRVPFGYVSRRYVRPVETNTIFHVLPGARALTFGMYGCDLRCPYCHNHRISQAVRDGDSAEVPTSVGADELVAEALAAGCRVVCAAYNEPMISAEWTREVFRVARRHGLRTAVVSDGNSTPEALRYLREDTDVFRIDLKASSEAAYKTLGGRLQPVLDSIALARELGYWVEVVTLVVPGLNQEQDAIARLGAQLREISPNIPWHLNGFVPRYRFAQVEPASSLFLTLAAGAAYVAGTRFVYVGNLPSCAELAHTRCPSCHTVLVRRSDYATTAVTLTEGACSACSAPLPGMWQ
jgi:pyruvate formate lyase activating enzyme